MILLANGCSWTYGGSLDQDITRKELDQITWPKHLADMLGATSFVNLADGCGSNQRTFRTTLDYLLHKKHDTEIVAVIQFTEESRYEYYYPLNLNNKHENISTRWMKAKVNNLIPEKIVDEFGKHYALSQERIKYHTSDIQQIYTYIEHCEALSNLFKKYNIKFYFWDFTNYPNNLLTKYRSFMLESYPWLIHDTYGMMYEYDRVGINDPHPSINGHKQIAKIMYDIIKKDSK